MPVQLRVLRGASADHAGRAQLCEAWRTLERWEHRAQSALGADYPELLVVLWTVHRFAVCSTGMMLLDTLLDESMHLRDREPLLEDVASLAFALGASWASRSDLQCVGRPG